MSSRHSIFRSAGEFAGFYALVSLMSWLPIRLAVAVGRWAGQAAFLADGKHRRAALENARMALGMSDAEARTFARRVYAHLGETFAESIYMWVHLTRANLGRYVEVEGIEHLRAAAAAGRGVVCVTGHIGNWELGGLVTGHLYGGIVSMAQPLHNPWVDAFVMRFRARAGQRIVSRKGGVRAMVLALREGKALGMLIDQDARRHGIVVPFFGLPASTIPSAARIALGTGAPIVAGYVHRLGPLRYRARYLPPIYLEAGGDRDEKVKACTEELNRIIEEAIRLAPEQWLWPHRRWKHGLRVVPPAPSFAVEASASEGSPPKPWRRRAR